MKIGRGISFECENGGIVTMSQERMNLKTCGIRDGFAFFEDVYINSNHDMSIDIAEENTKVTLENKKEESVVSFGLMSLVHQGTSDFKFLNLEESSWYRLLFDGELAETETNVAHGRTDSRGSLLFENVIVRNE